ADNGWLASYLHARVWPCARPARPAPTSGRGSLLRRKAPPGAAVQQPVPHVGGLREVRLRAGDLPRITDHRRVEVVLGVGLEEVDAGVRGVPLADVGAVLLVLVDVLAVVGDPATPLLLDVGVAVALVVEDRRRLLGH